MLRVGEAGKIYSVSRSVKLHNFGQVLIKLEICIIVGFTLTMLTVVNDFRCQLSTYCHEIYFTSTIF